MRQRGAMQGTPAAIVLKKDTTASFPGFGEPGTNGGPRWKICVLFGFGVVKPAFRITKLRNQHGGNLGAAPEDRGALEKIHVGAMLAARVQEDSVVFVCAATFVLHAVGREAQVKDLFFDVANFGVE